MANEHITYVTWQSMNMTGVPLAIGAFIVVCDLEPPPTDYGERRRNPRRPTGEKYPKRRGPARRGLDQYGLAEHEDFKRAPRARSLASSVSSSGWTGPAATTSSRADGRDASELERGGRRDAALRRLHADDRALLVGPLELSSWRSIGTPCSRAAGPP